MDNLQERFPIVDEEGTVIGQATRGECHNGSRLLHAVVHLHVFNAQGDVYLQKRPEWKSNMARCASPSSCMTTF